MPANDDPGQALVRLGVQLLDLARHGTRTATYKPATLLALVDVLAARADAQGKVPDEVPVRAVAERVVALYWPQVRDYAAAAGTPALLRQLNDPTKQPVIVRAVRDLHLHARARGIHSASRAAAALPREHDDAVRAVMTNLARYPLARLQRPRGYRQGASYPRPLYDDSAFGGGGAPPAVIRLHPGVGERLISLSGLLVPVLQAEWTHQVAALNDLPSDGLRRHLFGAERQDLSRLREPLRDLQRQRCLYCDGRLLSGGQVDHVVPWVLHQEDSMENLVLAHDACNAAKSAYLLDVTPLTTWASRDLTDLAAAATAVPWRSDAPRVFALARSAYVHMSTALLWSPSGTRAADGVDVDSQILPLLRVA